MRRPHIETILETHASPDSFAALAVAWNKAALKARSPFLTHEWLLSWWRAFGDEDTFALALRDDEGGILAGGLLSRSGKRLIAGANQYCDDWDLIAVDEAAREEMWRRIGQLHGTRIALPNVPMASAAIASAAEALPASGYRVNVAHQDPSPWLPLPADWDELVTRLRQKRRTEMRRRKKRLEDEGELAFGTATATDLDQSLDRFFELEASGWKGEAGTAILNDPAAIRLYREFAHGAAAQGWLRIHFLELDRKLVAADYSCVIGDAAFLIKTCFDERYRRFSPGMVLRGEAIRAAIGDGLAAYDFLGGPDDFKLGWGAELRPRVLLRAYRRTALPAYLYRHRLRPLAAALRPSRARVPTDGLGS